MKFHIWTVNSWDGKLVKFSVSAFFIFVFDFLNCYAIMLLEINLVDDEKIYQKLLVNMITSDEKVNCANVVCTIWKEGK